MSRKRPIKSKNANKPKSELVGAADIESREQEHQRNLEDAVISTVNWQWRKFSLNIMNGMQKYAAYADAYGIEDVENNDRAYKVAAACSARLLKNASFIKYYRELLGEQGFNDDIADTRLLQALTSPDVPWQSVLKAIEQYNKLRGRIVDRSDITSKGRRILQPKVVSKIKPRNQKAK